MTSVISLHTLIFPVKVWDPRTGREGSDFLVIIAEQVHAAEILGLTSRTLISDIYRRSDAKVLWIGTPIEQKIDIQLSSPDGHRITIGLRGGDSNG